MGIEFMTFKGLEAVTSLQSASKCKGHVFRGKLSSYLNSKGHYVLTQSMILLKRKSCQGCEQCDGLNSFNEDLGMDRRPIMPEFLEDGALYKLNVVNVSRDWETGHTDDWDWEFIKHNECQSPSL